MSCQYIGLKYGVVAGNCLALCTFTTGVLDSGRTVEVILGSSGNTENYLLDGLYGPELSTYHHQGILGKLHLCWSWRNLQLAKIFSKLMLYTTYLLIFLPQIATRSTGSGSSGAARRSRWARGRWWAWIAFWAPPGPTSAVASPSARWAWPPPATLSRRASSSCVSPRVGARASRRVNILRPKIKQLLAVLRVLLSYSKMIASLLIAGEIYTYFSQADQTRALILVTEREYLYFEVSLYSTRHSLQVIATSC